MNIKNIKILARYLYECSDLEPFYVEVEKVFPHYSKQVCFKDFDIHDIEESDDKALAWFNQQYTTYWKKCDGAFQSLLLRVMQKMIEEGDDEK